MKEIDHTYGIRAQDLIAQGALTNSKRPECFVKGVYQTHALYGKGAYLHDISGRRLIDFICALGSNILGYGNHQVAESIYQQALMGPSLSLSTSLELKLAEKIREIMPWVRTMRFLKTGTEACMAAIRIARAKTNRSFVLSEGYHGHLDEFIKLTPPALGVNPQSSVLKLTDLGQISDVIAAVIIEPIMTDMSQERIQWLRDLRQKCSETGTILIFDEIITGFRTPKFTMSNFLGIEPDIICLGKAMGNGMPIACVAGKDSVMNCGEYFVSSTFAGEMCSMAASLSVISQMQSNKFNIQDLWSAGDHFQKKFNEIYPEKIRLVGYPTRAVFEGDLLTKALLWQEAYLADILFGSSFFFNFAHMPLSERVLNILGDILLRIKTGSVELKGELPKSPFAQKIREAK
jgi:glutamate-1-semialdehyde aminotransferase